MCFRCSDTAIAILDQKTPICLFFLYNFVSIQYPEWHKKMPARLFCMQFMCSRYHMVSPIKHKKNDRGLFFSTEIYLRSQPVRFDIKNGCLFLFFSYQEVFFFKLINARQLLAFVLSIYVVELPNFLFISNPLSVYTPNIGIAVNNQSFIFY